MLLFPVPYDFSSLFILIFCSEYFPPQDVSILVFLRFEPLHYLLRRVSAVGIESTYVYINLFVV